MSKLQNLSSWKQTLVVVIVFTVLCVLLGLVAEGGVRIRHYLKHGDMWGVEDTFTRDAETGLRVLIPSIERGGIRTNSLGFRSPELETPKPERTVRLAFLGGSTTYGAEVSGNEATWPYLVTESLKAQWPNVHFDFINAGTPGYAAKDSLGILRARVAQHQPDVIVIYHATNDLSLHSFNLAEEQGVAEKRTDLALSWPSRYSLLWYLVEKNLFVKRQQANAHNAEKKLKVDAGRMVAPFESSMKELGTAAKEVATFVAVATFSHHLREDQSREYQAKAAVTNLYYMPYMSITSIIEGFASYNDAIRRVAGELDLHLIEGEYEIPGDSVHFVDSVHLNDTGSQIMAARVTESLLAAPSFVQLLQRKQSRN